ncbi:MAG: hypothetical protein U0704_08590 [Candidatus Eisenbacteria bacterium]
MFRPRPAALATALCLSLAFASVASAGSIVLDPLTDELPPHPYLPVTQARILFLGAHCDGASCPPGDVIDDSPNTGSTAQFSLPSLWQDPAQTLVRFTELSFDVDRWTGSAEASIDPVNHRLSATTSNDGNGFSLSQSFGPIVGPDSWKQDFNALGVEAVRLSVYGDLSPSRPVRCSVQLYDAELYMNYALLEVVATQPGELVLPLGAFTRSGDFDFSIVSGISIIYDSNLPSEQEGTPRSFSVGPVSFDTNDHPVPANHTTWGRLKSGHR